jgi:hypothetical protein
MTLTDIALWVILAGLIAIVPAGCIVQSRMKKKSQAAAASAAHSPPKP